MGKTAHQHILPAAGFFHETLQAAIHNAALSKMNDSAVFGAIGIYAGLKLARNRRSTTHAIRARQPRTTSTAAKTQTSTKTIFFVFISHNKSPF